MSVPYNPTILTRRTEADLSSSEYLLVQPSDDDKIILATSQGELAMGSLTNDVANGSVTAAYVPVQVGGIIKVKVGANGCTAGSFATCDGATSMAETAASGDYPFGIALETHANGDIGSFLWCPGGQLN